MERITIRGPAGGYTIPARRGEGTVQRLAAFENAYERLTARQAEIPVKMEELKARGKQKSVQFRELFGEKLVNQNILTLWATYGVR